jgi:hypothetical protein
MSLRVGVDLDGVVANFRAAFEAVASAAGVALGAPAGDAAISDPLPSREIKRIWEKVKASPNWWATLEPHEPRQIVRLYETSRRLKWEVVFMTRRPVTAGDSVQVQSQWWLERQGFSYPAVVTVPGSRGELANALRLDVIVDDQLINCVDVVSASTAKALLLLRDPVDAETRDQALSRGIGVVTSLGEAVAVLESLHDTFRERRGRLQRLSDWFGRSPNAAETALPDPPNRTLAPLRRE